MEQAVELTGVLKLCGRSLIGAALAGLRTRTGSAPTSSSWSGWRTSATAV